MNSLHYPFEELPDFREGEFRSGAHNGCAEISYWPSGEWVVRAIALHCHNGKVGKAAAGKTIAVSRAYQGGLWDALCESLDTLSRDHIQDAVDQARAANGWADAGRRDAHSLLRLTHGTLASLREST